MSYNWISVQDNPPRKDVPIIAYCEYYEMPHILRWLEEGTYGEPGFFEPNEEYETKEKDITFWMVCPENPK